MFGLLLVAIGTFFDEVSISIGKYEITKKKETLYAMGFLSTLWTTLLFIGIGIYQYETLVFSKESLPTLFLRVILEVILAFITLKAIISADRSTFAFLRVFTIPLILIADIALGYAINLNQIIGIIILVLVLMFLSLNNGLSAKGKIISLFSAIGAAITISLFKYNITNFNSVVIEQTASNLAIIITLLVLAKTNKEKNLFSYLKKPLFFWQSLAAGIGAVFVCFSYLFAPASVITAAKRAGSILFAILFGNQVFHEKRLAVKIVAFLMLSLGVYLIAN